MILIGQYDSPFVRRVAIALHLYKLPYEHRPWSVFGDAEKLAEFNPLRRVPTLIIDDGEVLIESGAILDYLDQTAGPERALIPAQGEARRRALKTIALATGMGEKAVSLVYERVLHDQQSETWIDRCHTQIGAVLNELEAERETRVSRWWYGETIGHADIAVGCVLRFIGEAHPGVFDANRWPRLAAHAAACEALEQFQAVQQAFHVTPPKSG
jgi:glutathione S-transferase